MSIGDYYNKTVVIKRKTNADDDYGSSTVTWGTQIASWKCRFSRPVGNMKVLELGEKEILKLDVLGGIADIVVGDLLVDGIDEYDIEKVYRVSAKSLEHHLELEVTKRK